MTLARRVLTMGLILAALAPALAAAGQTKPEQTATQFYQEYRKVFTTATKIEDIAAMMSESRRAQVEKTPADDRKMMFDMVKAMTADQGDVKVLKETPTPKGAELAVESKSGTGTVFVVKESGAWKIDKESWKGQM